MKNEDGTIYGMVDGSNQKYYPTILAIFGAQKSNIKLDLTLPTVDDGYAKLTWYFSDKPSFATNIDTKILSLFRLGFISLFGIWKIVYA